MKLFFVQLLSVLVNVVEVVTLLTIHMLNFLFQIKYEILMESYLVLYQEYIKKTFSSPRISCNCKSRVNEILCNSKQKWNHDEYLCECKK